MSDRVRIIPAYAGSTHSEKRPILTGPDHPRVCGEHIGAASEPSRSYGSSPRMRGAPAIRTLNLGRLRIIPAYAGSTLP